MLLKKGDNNEQVKQLQVKLGVDPVGNFGPKTEEAVKKYQAANGLVADGIVGDSTWNKIMGSAPAAPAAPAPSPTLAIAAAPTVAPSNPFGDDDDEEEVPVKRPAKKETITSAPKPELKEALGAWLDDDED